MNTAGNMENPLLLRLSEVPKRGEILVGNPKKVWVSVRVEKDVKERFIKLCRLHNLSPSEVLRSLIREFIKKHKKAGEI